MAALADDLAAESAMLRALLVPLDGTGGGSERGGLVGAGPGHPPRLVRRGRRALGVAAGGVRGRAANPDPDGVAAEAPGPVQPERAGLVEGRDARSRGCRRSAGSPRPCAWPWWPVSGRVGAHRAMWRLGARPGRRRHPRRAAGTRHGCGTFAHIGMRARTYSYVVNGKQPPGAPLGWSSPQPVARVDLGPEDAPDRVAGPALDFCLAVTQRRHLADTAVEVRGPVASRDGLCPGLRGCRRNRSCAENVAGRSGTGRFVSPTAPASPATGSPRPARWSTAAPSTSSPATTSPELTMLILAKAQAKDPGAGYARTSHAGGGRLGPCLERGVKIVSNAGGLNPAGLAQRRSGR